MDIFQLCLQCDLATGMWIWVMAAGVLMGCSALTPAYCAHVWLMLGVAVLLAIPVRVLPFTGEASDCIAAGLLARGFGADRLIADMHHAVDCDVALAFGGTIIVAVLVFALLRLLMRWR